MPIPGQILNVLDPGLGLVEAAPTAPLFVGVAATGTDYVLNTFANKNAVIAEYGQGPLSEAICKTLDLAGGPVRAMKVATTVAATIGAVTPVRTSTSTGTVTTGGTALDSYETIVEILVTGTLGTATFRYSLDDGRTFSEEIVVPAGGSFLLPETGITITFVVGAGPIFFEDGDTHSFDVAQPFFTVTELALAVTALLADSTSWAFLVLVGIPVSAAAAATIFAALATHMATFQSNFRWARAMMDGGDDTTANWITSFSAVSDLRVAVSYGYTDVASSKPFAGWGTPRRSKIVSMAARAAGSLISTDLARVRSGSVTGVVSVSHDEFQNEVIDAHRGSTMRTWPGLAGFYITNMRLKSPAGSDFRYWQHGRVMDVACATVFTTQAGFISSAVRTNADGTINEKDAVRFERQGNSALRAQLTQPDNAEGTRGHVSDLSYTIDRTNNIATSETLLSEVAIRPLGYAKQIVTQIGFALEV